MIEVFQIGDGMSRADLMPEVYSRSFDDTEAAEVLTSIDILRIWEDRFQQMGRLVALEHRSGSDDPPDVTAIFSGGRLDLEHTSIEPGHRHWAEDVVGLGNTAILPASREYTSREQIERDSSPWNVQFTAVSDEVLATYKLVMAAKVKKIQKCPAGGIMVLESRYGMTSDQDVVEIMRLCSEHIEHTEGWDRWAYSLIIRANPSQYLSTFFSKDHPFETRRS